MVTSNSVSLASASSCALTPPCCSGREAGAGIGLLLPRLFDQGREEEIKTFHFPSEGQFCAHLMEDVCVRGGHGCLLSE